MNLVLKSRKLSIVIPTEIFFGQVSTKMWEDYDYNYNERLYGDITTGY
jgi:hypothetical protein